MFRKNIVEFSFRYYFIKMFLNSSFLEGLTILNCSLKQNIFIDFFYITLKNLNAYKLFFDI